MFFGRSLDSGGLMSVPVFTIAGFIPAFRMFPFPNA